MAGLWKRLRKKPKQEVHADSLQQLLEKRFGYELQKKRGTHRRFEHPHHDVPMIHYPVKGRKVKEIYVERVVGILLQVNEIISDWLAESDIQECEDSE